MALFKTMLNIALDKGAKAIQEQLSGFKAEQAPRTYTSNIEKAVVEIVAETLKLDVHKVNLGDRLASLGANDYKTIDIIRGLEREFVISVNDDDIPNLQTIDDLINYVSVRL